MTEEGEYQLGGMISYHKWGGRGPASAGGEEGLEAAAATRGYQAEEEE